MKFNKTIVFLTLFLLTTLKCLGQNVDDQRLSFVIDSIMKSKAVTGLQVVIVSKDSIMYQDNFGKVQGSEKAITDKTMFCVSSITKSFTALGMMMLMEEGKLNLNDKLIDIAPEISFDNPWEETHPLKIVHLLEHTTGWSDVLISQYIVDRSQMSSLEQANDFPKSRISRYPPGQFFSYQNSGPTIGGYLIEKIAGMPYEKFIKTRILNPLGMNRSTYNPRNANLMDNLAIELGDNAPYRLTVDKPSGGMFTNSLDMAKYLQMFLNEGKIDSTKILESEAIERMSTSTSTLSGQAGYEVGYGLGLWSDYFKGVKIIAHSGEQPGFGSYMALIPELDRAFFVASNSELSLLNTIIEQLQNSIVDPKNAWQPMDGKPSKRFDLKGFYRSLNTPSNAGKPGYFIEHLLNIQQISEAGGELYFSTLANSKRYSIIQDGENHVYYYDEHGNKNWFFTGADWQGDFILQNGKSTGNFKKISALSACASIVLSIFCFLIIITLPFVCLIRLFRRYISKKDLVFQRPIQFAIAAIFSFVLFLLVMISSNFGNNASLVETWALLDKFGNITFTSISVFVLTLLFGLLSIGVMLSTFVNFKKYYSNWLRAYTLALSIAFVATSIYLWSFHFIGFKSWIY